MIIISWDVGIIHLAYCILEYIDNNVRIIDWNNINLIDDDRIDMLCCGETKTGKCNNKASYHFPNRDTIGFCKTHLAQASNYWSEKKIRRLFVQCKKKHHCGYMQKTGKKCGKNAKYCQKENKIYYCTAHCNSELSKMIKGSSPKPIKNTIVKKYPTSQLQFNLVKKLDALVEHFANIGIEEVIIENQPSQKNPKMKSIANTLFDYFMIRGYVDKVHNLDIQLVRFICPSNKLKVNKKNTIKVLKRNKNRKYKLTKALGIKYTKKLLKKDPMQLEYLDLYKKKDDLCDAYLQGRYYLEFVRIKSGSKTAKKRSSKKKIDLVDL